MNIISHGGDMPRDPTTNIQIRVEQDGGYVFQLISILALNEYMSSLSTPRPKRGEFPVYNSGTSLASVAIGVCEVPDI